MYDFCVRFKYDKFLVVDSFISNESIRYNVDGIDIRIYGYVINSDNVFKRILENELNGKNLNNGIFGKYTIFYVDYKKQKITVISDCFGGYKNVYYTKRDEYYYIFSSPQYIKNRGHKIKFNYGIVNEFIYNGVIKTRDTLFCGIYRLLPYEAIIADYSSVTVEERKLDSFCINRHDLDDLYVIEKKIVEDYISQQLVKDQEINIALSSGYDSNFLLYIVESLNIKRNINAFTCGGERGVDETSTAQQIANLYGNINIQKSVVGCETLNKLMDIAKRLEGAVYERGIFLQYELASSLSKNGVKSILLGECADQVFNVNFYDVKERQFMMNYIDNPYELGTLLVLKKSSLMLDSFGIVGLYPFTDQRMLDMGYNTRLENNVTKEFQKKMCEQNFSPELRELVGKKPGSTSLCSLFFDKEAEEKFINHVKETNEFYDPLFKIPYRYEERESILDYYICLEYLLCIKKVYCD